MPRSRYLALVALACTAAPAAAQSPEEPQLVFSIAGGIVAGGGRLWELPRQGVRVVGTSPLVTDTMGLARYLRPGAAATVSATLYRSRHLGFVAEGGYFGIASEQRCTPPTTFKADAEGKNQQACSRAQGTHVPTSMVGFLAGLGYRVGEGGRIEPSARIGIGVGFIANSYVRTEGAIQSLAGACGTTSTCQWPLIDGESTPQLALIGTLGVGTSVRLSPGYRVRFEARDLVARVPVAEAHANPATGMAPVASVVRHIPTFTVGIDVVLERRRGRRY